MNGGSQPADRTKLRCGFTRSLLQWFALMSCLHVVQRSLVAYCKLVHGLEVRNYMGFPRCCPGVGQACSEKVRFALGSCSHSQKRLLGRLSALPLQDLRKSQHMQTDWRIPYCCKDEQLYSLIGEASCKFNGVPCKLLPHKFLVMSSAWTRCAATSRS